MLTTNIVKSGPASTQDSDKKKAKIVARQKQQHKKQRQIVEELEEDPEVSDLISDRDLAKLYK
jgi:hypothetical protein